MKIHRILFCTFGYAPAVYGGAERQAQLQAESLRCRGYQVSVVCPRSPGTRTGEVNGILVRRLPYIDRRPYRTPSYLISLFVFLFANLLRFDLACVHLGYFTADAAVIVGRILQRPIWVKLAASGHQGEIQRMRRVAWLTRYIGLRQATRVQATSPSIAAEALSLGVRRERIVHIPNGVDTSLYVPAPDESRSRIRSELSLPSDRVVVLFIGRFARHKGVVDLLEAWQLLDHGTATLALVGSTHTMDAVAVPQDSEDVTVRPWTTSVKEYYQAADVFVLPSHVEGMSNAMLEAMACGMPVICTRVGAAESIIEHGRNGLLVPSGAPNELAIGLRRLIADGTMRTQLGAAAVKTVRDRFSIDRVSDMLEAEYRRIAIEA